MNASESRIQSEIMLAIGAMPDLMIMRNHVGVAKRFDAKTHTERVETFGLGTGSTDVVCMLAPSGRWVCLEIKTEAGRLSPKQFIWHRVARAFGAFVAVVRSADQAIAAVERARKGESE